VTLGRVHAASWFALLACGSNSLLISLDFIGIVSVLVMGELEYFLNFDFVYL